MKLAATVLVIEDERPILNFLRASLGSQGYRVLTAQTAREGLAVAATDPPDLVVLDLGLPDLDGLEVIRSLREWSMAPIIVLSARADEGEKVRALDEGADDYVTKPFGIQEFLARLRVAERRRSSLQESESAVFELGELKVDLQNRRVHRGAEEIHLTPIEYRLLATMVRHAGKVLVHRFLLKEVWGPANTTQTTYLRVFMAALRKKIEPDPARPRYLLTELGVGYRLADR